ncbi:hypothetical protein, partial [Streptacidiphilus griseoplanus]|uniref:hypothetical protein n=1 Tax=Peterkaempfera griseoplana TaxID=66896 RepID=UPI001C37B69E
PDPERAERRERELPEGGPEDGPAKGPAGAVRAGGTAEAGGAAAGEAETGGSAAARAEAGGEDTRGAASPHWVQ